MIHKGIFILVIINYSKQLTIPEHRFEKVRLQD